MSQIDDIPPEYKTIRISAPMYYKLVEIAGMLSAVTGVNSSISGVADMLISMYYDQARPQFLKMLNNPKELQKIRNEIASNVKEWYDVLKDVKVTQ
ncbi:MAG: hypothetical protein ACREBU_08315 [Nitrososphaera sp.]